MQMRAGGKSGISLIADNRARVYLGADGQRTLTFHMGIKTDQAVGVLNGYPVAPALVVSFD